MPKLDRVYRLYVIMSVDKYCRQRWVYELLSEDHRMAGCRIYCSFICARLLQEFDKTLCTALHVRLVLLQRTHGRNSQQRKQFLEESVSICLDI